jgi:hypothetical protein
VLYSAKPPPAIGPVTNPTACVVTLSANVLMSRLQLRETYPGKLNEAVVFRSLAERHYVSHDDQNKSKRSTAPDALDCAAGEQCSEVLRYTAYYRPDCEQDQRGEEKFAAAEGIGERYDEWLEDGASDEVGCSCPKGLVGGAFQTSANCLFVFAT